MNRINLIEAFLSNYFSVEILSSHVSYTKLSVNNIPVLIDSNDKYIFKVLNVDGNWGEYIEYSTDNLVEFMETIKSRYIEEDQL